MSFNHGSATLI